MKCAFHSEYTHSARDWSIHTENSSRFGSPRNATHKNSSSTLLCRPRLGLASVVPMEQNFGHMVYHAWQVRLLVATSCCFLVVAGVAHLSFAQTELSYVLGALGCTSLNYWRSPGDSWRRTADLCCASFALVYTFAHGWWGDDTTVVNAVGWTANTFGIYCFRCSWKVSLGNSTHWAV
jgi:hypothetical protein